MPPAASATAADYRQTPEGPPWYQLIAGELVQEPSPNVAHQRISRDLGGVLDQHVKSHRLGEVLAAPMDVWLNDQNVFQPDILFVAAARLNLIRNDGIHGPPDMVVEILSPSSLRHDSIQKLAVYAKTGVREYWLVDPVSQEIAIYRFGELADRPVQRAVSGDSFQSPLFPGLAIYVGTIFRNR